jgi:hypothetical protein
MNQRFAPQSVSFGKHRYHFAKKPFADRLRRSVGHVERRNTKRNGMINVDAMKRSDKRSNRFAMFSQLPRAFRANNQFVTNAQGCSSTMVGTGTGNGSCGANHGRSLVSRRSGASTSPRRDVRSTQRFSTRTACTSQPSSSKSASLGFING